MARRTTILALWTLAGWTLGGFLSWMAGLPEPMGPLLGGLGALIVTIDPRTSVIRHRIGPSEASRAVAGTTLGEAR